MAKIKRKKIPFRIRKMVFEKDGYRCQICGATSATTKLEVDHIIPLARGGTDDFDNLITLCCHCNHGKNDNIFRITRKKSKKKIPRFVNFGYYADDIIKMKM